MLIKTIAPKAANREIGIEYPHFTEKSETVSAADALAKNVETFGPEVVLSVFLAEAVVKFQARVRANLEKGTDSKPKTTHMDDASIEADAINWKPGIAVVRKGDKVERLLSDFDGMSEEKQNELLEKLLAKANKTA